jgi:hypothetical protein
MSAEGVTASARANATIVSRLGDTRPVSSLLNIALLILARRATSASVSPWPSRKRRAVRPRSIAGLAAGAGEIGVVFAPRRARGAARAGLGFMAGIAQ